MAGLRFWKTPENPARNETRAGHQGDRARAWADPAASPPAVSPVALALAPVIAHAPNRRELLRQAEATRQRELSQAAGRGCRGCPGRKLPPGGVMRTVATRGGP